MLGITDSDNRKQFFFILYVNIYVHFCAYAVQASLLIHSLNISFINLEGEEIICDVAKAQQKLCS